DFSSGITRRILELEPGRQSFHPHWSPFGDNTILFVTAEFDGDDIKKKDGLVPFSVWTIGADGGAPRRIVDALAQDDDFASANFVTWGPAPGTLVYSERIDEELSLTMLHLESGESLNILPHRADASSLEFSPSRTQIALV